MHVSELDRERKRLSFSFAALLGLLLLTWFSVTDAMSHNTQEFLLDVSILLVVAVTLVCNHFSHFDAVAQRIAIIALSIGLLYGISIGGGGTTVTYWTVIPALLGFYFFGRVYGSVFAFVQGLCASVLIFAGDALGTQVYSQMSGVRFLYMYVFLSMIAFGGESTRLMFSNMVHKIHDELVQEKQRLEAAQQDVMHLRGMLPICAHCKKIRDDQGYWNQIEAYITKHSGAEFSHGICPDCIEKVFGEFEERKTG